MLALRDEFVIKPFHHRVMLNRTQHGHIQHGPDGRSPAFDSTSAFHVTAVAIKRRESCEGGDLTVRQFRDAALGAGR